MNANKNLQAARNPVTRATHATATPPPLHLPPAPHSGRPGERDPASLVEIIVAGYRPQQAAGDAWCGMVGMRRFSLIGEF